MPEFRPSAAHRWLECTASVNLPVPEGAQRSTVYQEHGTLAHAMLAYLLDPTQELPLRVSAVKLNDGSTRFHVPADSLNLDEYNEMVEVVQIAYAYIHSFQGQRFVERGVRVDGIDVKGTPDCVVIEPKTLHVFDFKYGQGVEVSPRGNQQLLLYAMGVLDTLYDEMVDDLPSSVVLHIVQPRMDNITHWETTTKFINEWRSHVRDRVEEAERGGQYRPGEEQCRWCHHKANCIALHDATVEDTLRFFTDVPEGTIPNAQQFDNVQLSEILDNVELLEMFIKAVQKEAFERMMDGQHINYWKLVLGRTKRKFDDETAVLELLQRMRGINVDEYAPRKLLGPAPIEKMLPQTALAQKVLSHIIKPEGKPTLVRESDPRPAYQHSTIEDFEDEQDLAS